MAAVCRMVCLANSRKRSGQCVAEKMRRADGSIGWIRPISARPNGEVLFQERRVAGREPALLDILDVPMHGPRGHGFQTENWVLDDRHRWSLSGQAEWRHLAKLADQPASLWANGRSTPHGKNDVVSLVDAETFPESLFLLAIDRLRLRVFAPGARYGDPIKRVQAVFEYGSEEYAVRVTDPVVEQAYLVFDAGRFDLKRCYITVSLGEAYAGNCYKLVAAVFIPEEGDV